MTGCGFLDESSLQCSSSTLCRACYRRRLVVDNECESRGSKKQYREARSVKAAKFDFPPDLKTIALEDSIGSSKNVHVRREREETEHVELMSFSLQRRQTKEAPIIKTTKKTTTSRL